MRFIRGKKSATLFLSTWLTFRMGLKQLSETKQKRPLVLKGRLPYLIVCIPRIKSYVRMIKQCH